MTNAQFVSLMIGGWTVLLALVLWACLLQPRARPGSLARAMLPLGLITTSVTYSHTKGALLTSLLVAAMPLIGVAIGELGNRQWDKMHRDGHARACPGP